MARNISSIVDEQIRRWSAEQKKSSGKAKKDKFSPERVITLSNAYGSNGIAVAEKVGKLLNIPVHDREIVEHIATKKKVRVEAVESLDQKALGAVDDYLVNLFRERNFDQGDYMQALTRTITSLWAHGSCVLIGRGAGHIVSRRYALGIRVVAPLKHRIRRVEDLTGLKKQQAILRLERTDAERESFVRRLFGQGIDDPLCYDLIINTGGVSTEASARLIVEAFRQKFPKG